MLTYCILLSAASLMQWPSDAASLQLSVYPECQEEGVG